MRPAAPPFFFSEEHQRDFQRAQARRRTGAGALVGLAISTLVAGSSASGASASPERILASSSDGSGPEVGVEPGWDGSAWAARTDNAGQGIDTPPGAQTTTVPVSEATDLGIPDVALDAYRSATASMDEADPGCRIHWSLIAGIGRVESDHGQYGGRQPAANGTVAPPILGIALDGRPGVALIRDTDGGRLDFDTTYDRAVGPMQFIPGTWSAFPDADGDGNGVADPHNLNDAALAAANYLCSGPGNLSEEAGQRSAVFRYNHSDSYVDLVLAYAQAYAAGVKPSGPPPQPAGPPPVVPDDPITNPAHPGDPLSADSSGPPATTPPLPTTTSPPTTTEPTGTSEPTETTEQTDPSDPTGSSTAPGPTDPTGSSTAPGTTDPPGTSSTNEPPTGAGVTPTP